MISALAFPMHRRLVKIGLPVAIAILALVIKIVFDKAEARLRKRRSSGK